MEPKRPLPYQMLKESILKQGRKEISYEELLWTQEWLFFRNEIKDRDKSTCTICSLSQYKKMTDEQFVIELNNSGYGKYFDLIEGKYKDEPNEFTLKKNLEYPSNLILDENVKLEVHHKYYIWKKRPWEYDQSALTTLCHDCHEKEHFAKKRIIYSDDTLTHKKTLKQCHRCNGSGYIREYTHVQNGVCFNCGGLGGVLDGTNQNLIAII